MIIDIALIIYSVLIVGMWVAAIIVRLLAARNHLKEKTLGWLQGFARLRKLFGWMAIGLLFVSLMLELPILLPGVIVSRLDAVNAVELASLLFFLTSFYLGALWFMLGGALVNRPLEAEVGERRSVPVPKSVGSGSQLNVVHYGENREKREPPFRAALKSLLARPPVEGGIHRRRHFTAHGCRSALVSLTRASKSRSRNSSRLLTASLNESTSGKVGFTLQ